MSIKFILDFISNHSLPIFIVVCYLYVLYYVWSFITKELKPSLTKLLDILEKLALNTRTVENDVEKLNQKVSIITVVKNEYSSKL